MSKSTLLCILFLGLSSTTFAQFYVQQGVVLNLETPKTTLSVQEAQLHINAPIQGQGTLVFNSFDLQTLESTQSVLEVSNFSLEHAHLVKFNTALRIEQQLTLQSGALYLSHLLYLTDQTALVLLNNSGVTSKELLVSDHQIIDHRQQYQWVWTHSSISTSTTQTCKEISFTQHSQTNRSNFGTRISNYKILNLQCSTPPPEATPSA